MWVHNYVMEANLTSWLYNGVVGSKRASVGSLPISDLVAEANSQFLGEVRWG